MRASSNVRRAFTLIEMLVSMSAGAAILASVVYSSISLQRSFIWSSDYSADSIAQLRAVDYITRDIRGALTVTIPPGGQTLSLEMPDYYAAYDAQGNPTGVPVDPTIVNGVPQYGDPARPVAVTYFVSGTSLLRDQVVLASEQKTQVVVASGISDFALSFAGLSTVVKFSLTFTPKHRAASAASTAGTTVSATVSARTIRFK